MAGKALVIGGSGLVGVHLVRELLTQGWAVVSTQRRLPAHQPSDHQVLALDVLDRTGLASALAHLHDVTHIFFLARAWQPGYVIQREANAMALAAVLDTVQDWPSLKHVQLVHGLKWYGSTQGPFKTPARETDARPPTAHFYYEQHALVQSRQQGRAWSWSTLRPHCVSGVAIGSPSNVMLGIGVYAALAKEQGLPLCFPASQASFNARLSYTNAQLLARAMAWAATSPRARNQDFNIANGDTFSWQDIWPALAQSFGMQVGPPSPRQLSTEMPALSRVWHRLAQREGLTAHELAPLVDWSFMDATLALQWAQTMALEKIHQHGFTTTVDTPTMVLDILANYRRAGILPRI